MAYNLPSGGVTVPVIDNLTTASATSSLSANQGLVLEAQIVAAQAKLKTLSEAKAQVVVTANGQTAFTLPSTPLDPLTVVMNVNGVDYVIAGDFTVTGAAITWVGGFKLAATDTVYFTYV